MSDDDVLEHSSQDETSSVDVAELLEIANSKVFDDQDGLIERKKNFEKVTSFFDLIKSSNNEDANLAERIQSPDSSAEEALDEEIVGLKVASSDGATDDHEIDEEDTCISKSGANLLIDPLSLQYLSGSTIDYVEDLTGSKFIVKNPNAVTTCGCGESFSI